MLRLLIVFELHHEDAKQLSDSEQVCNITDLLYSTIESVLKKNHTCVNTQYYGNHFMLSQHKIFSNSPLQGHLSALLRIRKQLAILQKYQTIGLCLPNDMSIISFDIDSTISSCFFNVQKRSSWPPRPYIITLFCSNYHLKLYLGDSVGKNL